MMVDKIRGGGILRSGYTTGACAAAAAKAATMLLLNNIIPPPIPPPRGGRVREGGGVEIPFPDGNRHKFKIHDSGYRIEDKTAWSSVIKDAGDDPDVTNGAEIMAEVVMRNALCVISNNKNTYINSSRITDHASLIIKGGKGVGIVTKPGLSVPVGEPAINPVPRRMITEAVMEAIIEQRAKDSMPHALCPMQLEITISVKDGEKLAKKTLNQRLGIVGGISILGTTGIVKPLSTEAWTASISSAMDVAVATGNQEIALSAGRVSEKAHMKKFNFPEEAYIMMGDYLEFSLLDAKKHQFRKIHLCAQWAKMLKIAMMRGGDSVSPTSPLSLTDRGSFGYTTHVRHGAINVKKAVELLNRLGIGIPNNMDFNTAREIYDYILSVYGLKPSILQKVCRTAKAYAESIANRLPVIAHLVSYEGEIIVSSE